MSTLRVHHLNCGTLCPACAPLIHGPRGLSGWLQSARMVCHVLLIETPQDGLILVDTALGRDDLARPAARLGRSFVAITRPVLRPEQTAHAQIRALGLDPADVRHIILTHLDLDHAGGLSDFPQAQVHVHEAEYQAAMHPDWRSQARYRACQWSHQPRWVQHRTSHGAWQGLQAITPIEGLQADLALVPLIGHTRGHCGVAVRTDQGWLLHAGDAYFHHTQLRDPAQTPLGIRLFEQAVQTLPDERRANLAALQTLSRQTDPALQIFSAHDVVEFERLSGSAVV